MLNHAGPTRMWTLVAVPPDADVPSGFLPKRGLKPNLQKCMYSTITIGGMSKQQPIVEVCTAQLLKLSTQCAHSGV
jgi:hypothetical protein